MMTTILKMDVSVPWISMNGITDFEITSSLLFQNDEEISKVFGLWMSHKDKYLIMFWHGQKKK